MKCSSVSNGVAFNYKKYSSLLIQYHETNYRRDVRPPDFSNTYERTILMSNDQIIRVLNCTPAAVLNLLNLNIYNMVLNNLTQQSQGASGYGRIE